MWNFIHVFPLNRGEGTRWPWRSGPPNFQEAMVNKLLSLASLSVQHSQASDKDRYTLIEQSLYLMIYCR